MTNLDFIFVRILLKKTEKIIVLNSLHPMSATNLIEKLSLMSPPCKNNIIGKIDFNVLFSFFKKKNRTNVSYCRKYNYRIRYILTVV